MSTPDSASLDRSGALLCHGAVTEMLAGIDTLVRQPFGLQPVELPSRVRLAAGMLGARSVQFELRADRGDGPVERLHVAHATGDHRCISSLMVLGLPRAESGDPVLFCEALAVHGRFHSVTMDLLPCGAERDVPTERLRSASLVLRSMTERPRSLSLRGAESSPVALCVSGTDTTPMFLPDVFHAYVTAWIGTLSDGGTAAQDCFATKQRRLLEQLGRGSGAHRVFASMFGSAFVDTAWRGVLFAPDALRVG